MPTPTLTADPYLPLWTSKMIEIWRDRIDLLAIHHTGALRASLHAKPIHATQTEALITFQFLQYGIYVDRGVGNGYRPGNGGDLQILSPLYRRMHHLGPQRERRPWYSRSYYISTEVLKDHLARHLHDQTIALLTTLDAPM